MTLIPLRTQARAVAHIAARQRAATDVWPWESETARSAALAECDALEAAARTLVAVAEQGNVGALEQ